jgi:hypothetical protein
MRKSNILTSLPSKSSINTRMILYIKIRTVSCLGRIYKYTVGRVNNNTIKNTAEKIPTFSKNCSSVKDSSRAIAKHKIFLNKLLTLII